jgi:hypothetical protein
MTKVERRRIGRTKWEQFKLDQPIQLTWCGTDTVSMDFFGAAVKYVNVFHIDHDDKKLTIWKVSMSDALSKFLDAEALYRVTISVLEKHIQLDIG